MKIVTLTDVSSNFEFVEVESIIFDIYVAAIDRVVGRCEFRYETGQDLWYYGQIGYAIYPPYRGNSYAYHACVEMFKILHKEKGLHEFIITCNPDNIASRKTIEKLNGEFIKTVDIDEKHELYRLGETQKNIYVIKLF